MEYAIECQKCSDYLGSGSLNPSHEIPSLCLSELEQWCMYTRSTKCSQCLELNLQGFVPPDCFAGLRTLYLDECEPTTSLRTNATPVPNGSGTAEGGAGVGSVPIVLFIGLIIIVMVMICKKLFQIQQQESGIDNENLITDPHDIRLDHTAVPHIRQEGEKYPRHFERIDSDGYSSRDRVYSAPHDITSGSGAEGSFDYRYHAHRYPEGRNAMTDHPLPTEDPYRYQSHRQPQHSKRYSDLSDSNSYSVSHSSYSYSKHSNSHSNNKRHSINHHEDVLDAQDSLRANGKDGLPRSHRSPVLAPLPPVHEDRNIEPGSPLTRRPESTTTARQLRINTLINQNTSTSSIYSGELLIPSKPVPRKESNDRKASAVSDSGTSNQLPPLKERIRRYSIEKKSSRSANRMTPERGSPPNHFEETDKSMPLKERIRSPRSITFQLQE